MGENKHIKELDAFVKKYVKEIVEEKPSISFTASLMNKIISEKKSEVFKVKALITKKGWFVISLLVAAIILIPFYTVEKNIFNIPKMDFSFFNKFQFSSMFESFSVSITVFYAIFFFGLMFVAQVIFLKNYFNKKFE